MRHNGPKEKRAFETACELVVDPGLIGVALRQFANMTAPLGPALVPDWLLCEADRWGNPWKFLLGVRDVPKAYRKVFAAADSQRHALLRFSRKAQRTGSLKTSQYDRLLAAHASGDKRAEGGAMKRIFSGMYRADRGRFLLTAAKGRSDLRAQIQAWIAELYAKDVRRLGSRKADAKPRRLTIADCRREYVACDRIAFTLVSGWLRGNKNGFPGFCFCSDEVLTTLIFKLLNLPVQLGTLRKLRQRLCLKKAAVLVREFRPGSNGTFELSDSRGKPIWRSVPPAK